MKLNNFKKKVVLGVLSTFLVTNVYANSDKEAAERALKPVEKCNELIKEGKISDCDSFIEGMKIVVDNYLQPKNKKITKKSSNKVTNEKPYYVAKVIEGGTLFSALANYPAKDKVEVAYKIASDLELPNNNDAVFVEPGDCFIQFKKGDSWVRCNEGINN